VGFSDVAVVQVVSKTDMVPVRAQFDAWNVTRLIGPTRIFSASVNSLADEPLKNVASCEAVLLVLLERQ
jgi:hypothetical protein